MLSAVLSMLLLLTGCGGTNMNEDTYQQITQEKAKEMMDTQDVLILDVRVPITFLWAAFSIKSAALRLEYSEAL